MRWVCSVQQHASLLLVILAGIFSSSYSSVKQGVSNSIFVIERAFRTVSCKRRAEKKKKRQVLVSYMLVSYRVRFS